SCVILLTIPWAVAMIAAGLTVLATVAAVGPLPVLAVALFVISSCALGSSFMRRATQQGQDELCATLLGMAAYVFLMNFLVRLPVNYPAVYLVLLAAPIAVDLRGTGKRLISWSRAFVQFRPQRREAAGFALLLFVVVMHWLIVMRPETGADA